MSGPCTGLSVVEVAVGVSELGLGLAGGVPGMLLASLGASVVRATSPSPLDADVPWGRAWHRDKRVVDADRDQIFALLRDADVALVYGPEELVEGRGLGYRDLKAVNPALVYARCRPSRTAGGTVADYGLLVEAGAGLCTQLPGHRGGPIFVDARGPGIGTAALLLTSVLGLLLRREGTTAGGWAETSLYDGMLATLGCAIGRTERAAPEIERYWEKGSTFPNFLYHCADDELIQVWFGGKGMYDKLIAVLGDEPSVEGYYRDQRAGVLRQRAARWVSLFAARPRDEWIRLLREAGVACEPVLAPGEALLDPHLAEIGLALPATDQGHDDIVHGSPMLIRPIPPAVPTPAAGSAGDPGSGGTAVDSAGTVGDPAGSAGGSAAPVRGSAGPGSPAGLLEGVRVVDFSAFVAGPLAAQVLADLGADVVKVEPPEGEAMRAAAYAVAACQRGKRSIALNIGSPEARPVVEALIRGADVVLHNWRVGVAERLGVGAEDVERLNPRAVYCHASAFGVTGRRALLPGNDALMQAATGFERALAGEGNEPIAATWIPIDMAGGWIAATAVLAGLLARARTGSGQYVATSLLGAGTLLHSGVYVRDGRLVPGPSLDGEQTGYGPGYRIYQGGDGGWFALVVPSPDDWSRLATMFPGLPEEYAPLRGRPSARRAEEVLTEGFARAPAGDWVRRLRRAGLPVQAVPAMDRDSFRQAVLDDPVNRQLGRAIGYPTPDWGHFEQLGPLLRCGPATGAGPAARLPGIGEHTVEILRECGRTADEIEALLASKFAVQLAD